MKSLRFAVVLAGVAVVPVLPWFGCGAENASDGSGSGTGANNGTGNKSGSGFDVVFPDQIMGSGGNGSGSPGAARCGQLIAIVRDFTPKHPDFESVNNGLQSGLVNETLDAQGFPVRAEINNSQLNSQNSFSQWYRDTPGTNQRFEIPLNLTQEKPGVFVFENNKFFPLDGKGFGNFAADRDGVPRNFHFTTEIRGRFKYQGGEVFTFKGDDDVWVFVNGKLGLDLGGVHGVETATLNFDALAGRLGIEKGKTYTLDVFHAERHTFASNFRMETSIECLSVEIL